MTNKFSNNYQYDSCISRGICSVNPRISAMQTVLILYFRLFAKYAIHLDDKGLIEERMKEFVLNSLSASIYNSEFNEETYSSITKVFREKLPEIIRVHNEVFPDGSLDKELEKAEELFQATSNIIQAIKFGEKRILKVQKEISISVRNLYNIILIIAKSLSINTLDLESFNCNSSKGFTTILKLLNLINLDNCDEENLKKEIFNATIIDNELMSELRIVQEKRYGVQTITDVSYSTFPAKAVLVVGTNIRELENVLVALEGKDIDVYTHDEMMLAHTFPKLREFSHLRGQYGQGLENCLLDFSTFPGPIILTKHSLHNIENLYRGRLFTTDYTCPKGVIRIHNNDYSEVIDSANSSKGFKRGKQCENVEIGFDFNKTVKLIKDKLNSSSYDNIVFIGLDNFSIEQKNYFNKLIKNLPQTTLVVSFSYDFEKENVININACFDSYSVIRVLEAINDDVIPITVFIPKCDRNSVSQMIYLTHKKNVKVFVGKCFPIMLNPALMNTLQDLFLIKSISVVKNDIYKIFNEI